MYKSVLDAVFSDHARMEMRRRGISESEVLAVLAAPEQMEDVRPGRYVYQSRQTFGDPPGLYLLRVFVVADREPPEIVTAYRTSTVNKYWR